MSHGDLTLLLLSLLGFVAIWRLTTGPAFRFSPALLFFSLLFLMQILGFLVVVDEGDRLDRLARLGMTLGVLGFVGGVVAANTWSRFHPTRELGNIRARFALHEPWMSHKVAIMIVAYLASVVILTSFYRGGGGIPLIEGISALASGDEFLTAQILLTDRRMELTYFEASAYRGQGYADQFRMAILPYLVACFLVWASVTQRRVVRFAGICAALPALLFLVGTGQRHPILSFIVSMSIIGYIATQPKNHKRILGWFGAGGFAVFAMLTFMLGRYTHTGSFGSDLPMVFVGIMNRVLFSNSTGTMALFHIFPNPEPYRWGWTWLSDLKGFLPGPHVGFSAWLYRRLYGDVGTAAPMCFGEMFANFGLVGVFLGAFALGVALQLLHIHWCRRRVFRAEHIVLYAMLSMSFARWAMGGLLGPIQHGLVALPVLYVLVQTGRNLIIVLSRFQRGLPVLAQRVGSRGIG